MPPRSKRSLDGGGSSNASAAKSKKASSNSTAGRDEDQSDARSKTLSPTQDLDPYEYVTICRPFWDVEAENAAKPESDQLGEDDLRKENRCGEELTCMCNKTPSEHPDWRWVVMREGQKRFVDVQIHSDYRNADAFGMHIFTDHHGYGLAEMVENLLLDFSKAKTPQEQWVVVETIAHWMSSDDIQPFNQIDDGERVSDTIRVVGTTLLAALNTLDRNDLLKPNSKIKDISLVMGLFLKISGIFGDAIFIGEEEQEWPEYIITYAKGKGIKLGDTPFGVEEDVNRAETDAKLPTRSGKGAEDRFNFKNLLKDLEKRRGRCDGKTSKTKIGGQVYDITKWTRAERAESAFDGKDPLPDDVIKGLKEGKEFVLA